MKCNFLAINKSWVAFAEDPKAIVLWIGGAFFGTFPTISYHFLLRNIHQAHYTVVALPYWLNLDHWIKAGVIYEEFLSLPQALKDEAKKLGYQSDIYLDLSKYKWAGHSLGCEYISLLDFLSEPLQQQKAILQNFQSSSMKRNLTTLQHITEQISITRNNQSALFIAPCFKPPFFIKPWVQPSQELTRCLLKQTTTNNPISMISFTNDQTAGNIAHQQGDVYWIEQNLSLVSHQEINGNHYTPIFQDQMLANLAINFLN